MKITALLPMKGHSERVSNKNMRIFADRPLFHCVMETLLESKYIDKIVVNTDSLTIKDNIMNHFKEVMVIDRPLNIRGDFVSMNDIIKYDLSCLKEKHYIQTHSTNPLLSQKTLDSAIEYYFNGFGQYDSLFSVTKIQTRLYWANGVPINHNPMMLIRTQDLESVFEENSNLYIFSKSSFHNAGNNRIGIKPNMFIMSKIESWDIDEPEDFEIAELLYKGNIKCHH